LHRREFVSRAATPGMRRRDFLGILGGATFAWPLVTRAQEAGRIYPFGALHPLPRTSPQFALLFDGLRRQGFLEGRNLKVRGFGSSAYREQAVQIVEAGVECSFAAVTLRCVPRSK